jgi:hypothetical protein
LFINQLRKPFFKSHLFDGFFYFRSLESHKMKKKQSYTVTPQGSLGLLALGDVGIRLWREAREKGKSESDTEKKQQHERKGKK